MREVSYEQAIDILTKQGGDTREVVLVSPTPLAKVEGEYMSQGYEVLLGNKAVALCVNPQVANKVTNILNTANTLAAENARLRAALTKIAYDPFGNPEATHADLLQTITEFAIATLEGGAK
jgi:hypothetical protein